MRRFVLALVALAGAVATIRADVTLNDCLTAASDNYPLIKKYDLLQSTEGLELSDINKGWLPRIGVYAQGTVQNVVPSFPSALSGMMEKMGADVRGLGKLQYKVGVDVGQTIWDGGASKAQRAVTRARADVDRQSLDVEMYGIRQRVETLYFGILLLEQQIKQTESTIAVYESSLERLRSMVANGTAMRCDADMVEAQMLTLRQQQLAARSASDGYRRMLSLFTGLNLAEEPLMLPSSEMPTDLTPDRPELSLLDARSALNNSLRHTVDVATMPKVGFFAQGYYGYPGIDYFKAMMGRELTFNIVAGVKASWNIDSFYTKKNSLRKLAVADSQIEADRATFLLNNSLQSAQQLQEIRGLEQVMAEDEHIVELRHNVRMAAESQLRNGVIDATALTVKINDEMQGRLAAAYHSIQRLQAIYNLKNTLNR